MIRSEAMMFIRNEHIQWDEIEGRTYLKEILIISKII